MKRLFLFAILAGASAMGQQQGCPIKPIKPIKPLYCPHMHAICVCDANGVCVWEWICSDQ